MWLDDVLAEILDAAKENLAACGDGSLCWVGLRPGDAVPDEICDEGCGQLTLNVIRVFQTDNFPNPADVSTGAPCKYPLAANLQLRVMRCFGDLDESGQPATPEDCAVAMTQQNADMMAMLDAINCNSPTYRVALDAYQPEGPLGNYVGGYWLFNVAQEV
jgi:hypothetical protein